MGPEFAIELVESTIKGTRVNLNRDNSKGPLPGALARSRNQAEEVRGAY